MSERCIEDIMIICRNKTTTKEKRARSSIYKRYRFFFYEQYRNILSVMSSRQVLLGELDTC